MNTTTDQRAETTRRTAWLDRPISMPGTLVIQFAAALLFTFVLMLGAYAWAAAEGHVPAMPWSPIGQRVDRDDAPIPEAPELTHPAPSTEQAPTNGLSV